MIHDRDRHAQNRDRDRRNDQGRRIDRAIAVTVVLEWQSRELTRRATGAPNDPTRALLIGETTLSAVEQMSGGRAGFRLRVVEALQAGGADLAVSVIDDPGLTDHPLVGSAVVDNANRRPAFARAVLDAVNRRLALSL